MKSGLKPRNDHRDYDFLKNHLAGGVGVPELPPTLGHTPTWVPNQNIPDPVFGNPALDYGCTDYSQAILSNDETGKPRNPIFLENITHANARGGADIRDAFKAAISLGWFTRFYNITRQGSLDSFDAFKVCLFLGKDEGRAISVGTPWFPEFESPLDNGVLPTPTNFDTTRASWHNWVIFDYKTIGDQQYLCGLSLQGAGYADRGVHYISRTLLNQLMSIPYANAFAGTQAPLPPSYVPFTVDLGWTQYVVSFVRMVANNYLLRPFK